MRYGLPTAFVLVICGTITVQAQTKAPRGNDRPAKSPAAKSPAAKRQQLQKATTTSKRTKPALSAKLTSKQKADALAFARTNHSELADLLVALKKHKPSFYDRGVRELFRASDRIAKLKPKNPDRHEFALKAWKLESRIRLLAARSTMSTNPMFEAELKTALRERTELRLQQLTFERDKARSRADKLNQMIDEITKDPDAAAQRDLERLQKSLRVGDPKSKKRKTQSTPAARQSKSERTSKSNQTSRVKLDR